MAALEGKTARIFVILMVILGTGLILGFRFKPPRRLSICKIQGTGEISPYSGKSVITQGVVMAVIREKNPRGLFLIDQVCLAEETGSGGIFIELGGLDNQFHRGDLVQVSGQVQEVQGETRIISDPEDIVIISLGNEIPPAIDLRDAFYQHPVTFIYEKWEGQWVFLTESEYLGALMDLDLPQVIPNLELDPSAQMICRKEQSIMLQISSSGLEGQFEQISTGDRIRNLSGFLRQNTNGYLLELISAGDVVVDQEAEISVSITKLTPSAVPGSHTEDLSATETAVIRPSGIPTITPHPTATTVPSPTWYPVKLLISEVYPNPSGKEPDGEWIEIYNPASYGQVLTGIKIGDETSPSGKEGMLRFPDGYYIQKKQVIVIASDASAFFAEFGILPDFEMQNSDSRIPDLLPYPGWGGSGVKFSNSGDEVLLLDPWDAVVDLLVYGNSTVGGFLDPPKSPTEGHSLERYPPGRDHDQGSDWRNQEFPSPGKLDSSKPTHSATRTPEATGTISPDPDPTLFPSSTVTPSLNPTERITDTPPSVQSQTPVISFTPDLRQSSSPTATQTVTGTLAVLPSATSVIIEPSSTGSPTLPLESPVSSPSAEFSLTPSQTETNEVDPSLTPSPSSSRTPTSVPLPENSATPIQNDTEELRINEILADPDLIDGDANRDGIVHSDNDEFIEFVNIQEDVIDLSGWSISDRTRSRFTFPEGTFLEGCQAVVIFGGGLPQGDFGGSLILVTGSLGLNNTGDIITLMDESGIPKIVYEYGVEGNQDQSLTRSPDIEGDLPLELHSEVPESLGVLFSPGLKLDGSDFPMCP